VHPDGPDVLAQVLFARDHEYALTVDDVVVRRTSLGLRGLTDEQTRERVATTLAGSPVPTVLQARPTVTVLS
jgi:glycerol-3-phosphate dehydrogenase